MLPFIILAFVPAFFDIEPSVSSETTLLPANPVTQAEWQNHFYFQSTFSTRSLFDFSYDGYMFEYTFSEDGLIIPVPPDGETAPPELSAPPFPLRELLNDLETQSRAENTIARRAGREFLYPFVPLLLIIPVLFRRRLC